MPEVFAAGSYQSTTNHQGMRDKRHRLITTHQTAENDPYQKKKGNVRVRGSKQQRKCGLYDTQWMSKEWNQTLEPLTSLPSLCTARDTHVGYTLTRLSGNKLSRMTLGWALPT